MNEARALTPAQRVMGVVIALTFAAAGLAWHFTHVSPLLWGEWTLVESTQPVEVPVQLSIDRSHLQIDLGCNRFGGSEYLARLGRITVIGDAASTGDDCGLPLAAAEATVMEALRQSESYHLDGDLLTIAGANDTQLTFTR